MDVGFVWGFIVGTAWSLLALYGIGLVVSLLSHPFKKERARGVHNRSTARARSSRFYSAPTEPFTKEGND